MAGKMKHSARAMSMPVGIGIGIGISLVLTLIGAGIVAYLVVSESIAESGIGYGSMIVLSVSSALGSLIAAGLIRHRRAMVCGLTGLGYYAMLLIITILCFGGEFSGLGVSALMVLIGVGLSMLPMLKKKGTGRKYKIPAYR